MSTQRHQIYSLTTSILHVCICSLIIGYCNHMIMMMAVVMNGGGSGGDDDIDGLW